MKILITGGAGYVGTELIQALSGNKNFELIVLDNLSRNNYNLFLGGNISSSSIKFIQGDILDSRQLSKILHGVDIVIHLAAKVTTPYADSELHQYEQINHWGTAELVYHVEKTNSVKKIIYLSSASVYGLGDNKKADESTEPTPTSHYGLSKLKGEKEVQLLSKSKEVQILRCANVFGYSRSMRFDSVINRFMFDAHFKNRIRVYGDGAQLRPFIYINQLINELKNNIISKKTRPIQNIYEFNFSLNEIIHEGILNLYPETEILYNTQDLPLKSLTLSSNVSPVTNDGGYKKFREYLKLFNEKFTF